MAQNTLVVERREPNGSRAANRLRAEGKIPGVVYGHGAAPVSVLVDRRDLRVALTGPSGVNALLSLTVDGKAQPAVVKQLQRHPVKRNVTHIDFQWVSLTEQIEVHIPIHLQGESSAVKDAGGIIDAALNSLTVHAAAGNIPTEITIDVSGMSVGDVIRVGDLTLPAGVTITLDPDTPVVTAGATSASLAGATEGESGEDAVESTEEAAE